MALVTVQLRLFAKTCDLRLPTRSPSGTIRAAGRAQITEAAKTQAYPGHGTSTSSSRGRGTNQAQPRGLLAVTVTDGHGPPAGVPSQSTSSAVTVLSLPVHSGWPARGNGIGIVEMMFIL
eukprot:573897-Rhodomonas_salina.2